MRDHCTWYGHRTFGCPIQGQHGAAVPGALRAVRPLQEQCGNGLFPSRETRKALLREQTAETLEARERCPGIESISLLSSEADLCLPFLGGRRERKRICHQEDPNQIDLCCALLALSDLDQLGKERQHSADKKARIRVALELQPPETRLDPAYIGLLTKSQRDLQADQRESRDAHIEHVSAVRPSLLHYCWLSPLQLQQLHPAAHPGYCLQPLCLL